MPDINWMTDLTEYGFVETARTETCTTYVGHGYRLVLFDYEYKQREGVIVQKKTWVWNTKQLSSMSYPMEELEQWLKQKRIKKVKSK